MFFSTSILEINAQPNCSHTTRLLRMLDEQHLEGLTHNDSTASQIFDLTIDALDPYRLYFLQSDLNALEPFRYELEDNNFAKACDFTADLSRIFLLRTAIVKKTIHHILQQPVNLYTTQRLPSTNNDIIFASSEKKLTERWRLWLNYSIINDVYISEKRLVCVVF